MTSGIRAFDIVVAGGGYVGLSLALGLAQAVPGVAVAVIDPRPWREQLGDPRASAVAAAGRRMLEALDVWPAMAGSAEAIRSMVVTDSRLDDRVRPVFLTFEQPGAGEPFAHMLPNSAMVGAIGAAAEALGVAMIAGRLADFTVGNGDVAISLAGGDRLRATLLVAADGAGSRVRALAGIGCNSWSYGQSGIVTTIVHELPHGGRAEEHFLPSGPFATLPLKDDDAGRHRSSLVWSERSETAGPWSPATISSSRPSLSVGSAGTSAASRHPGAGPPSRWVSCSPAISSGRGWR